MNGVPAGASSAPARSLTMPAHADAAGDQMTGGSPLASGLGQPSGISVAARPDATLRGRTNTQRSPTWARSDSLNSAASSVSRAIFSLLTAMSTTTQSPVSAPVRSVVSAWPAVIVVVATRTGGDQHDSDERGDQAASHVTSPHSVRRASIVDAPGTGWTAVEGSPHPAARSASAAVVATSPATDVPSGTASTASTHMVGSG